MVLIASHYTHNSHTQRQGVQVLHERETITHPEGLSDGWRLAGFRSRFAVQRLQPERDGPIAPPLSETRETKPAPCGTSSRATRPPTRPETSPCTTRPSTLSPRRNRQTVRRIYVRPSGRHAAPVTYTLPWDRDMDPGDAVLYRANPSPRGPGHRGRDPLDLDPCRHLGLE